MNLIVDVGNTRIKIAVIDKIEVIHAQECEELTEGLVDELKRCYPQLCKSIVSSTRGEQPGVVSLLERKIGYCLWFGPQVQVPIQSEYLTPQTLGRDRLAAAVGAVDIYPSRNVLIVDAGTALTIDFISQDGVYKGGVISPGMAMRFRALSEFTASLPLCEKDDAESQSALSGVGNTTRSAIARGVTQGICYEIEGYIERFGADFEKILIIFLGGDAKYLAKRIKNTIFANQNLIYCGLNRILEYNAGSKEKFS